MSAMPWVLVVPAEDSRSVPTILGLFDTMEQALDADVTGDGDPVQVQAYTPDDDGPCCIAFVTSRGQDHIPRCNG